MIQIPSDTSLSIARTLASSPNRDFRCTQLTLFLGFGVFDIEAATAAHPAPARGGTCREKVDAQVDVAFGGGAPNMARAYLLACGRQPALAAITGADPLGDALEGMLRTQFPDVHRIATADQTRLSVITPTDNGGTTSLTVRPAMDEAATQIALLPLLRAPARIVVASLTAQHGRFLKSLKQRIAVIDNRHLCLLLTRSQCEDRQATLDLCRGCQLVAMNALELEILTGIPGDVAAGIKWLRQRGVRGVFITDGCRGITVNMNDYWQHAPALRVTAGGGNTVRCGDIALGTFLCGLDCGLPIGRSLRLAAAAAAMKVGDVPRQPGWECLEKFLASTPPYRVYPMAAAEPPRTYKSVSTVEVKLLTTLAASEK